MALNLFKRVEVQTGLFAVEKISLIYSLLTSILILLLYQRMDHPLEMLFDRVLIAGVTFGLLHLYRLAPSKFSTFVRVAFQMSLLSYWYPDTFEFNRLFPNLDHIFASAEQSLFGFQPALVFCKNFPDIWFSEPINMGYFAYYPMILLVCVYYFICRFNQFEKISFILVSSFFFYFFVYLFVPVAGPQFYFPAIGLENVIEGNFPEIGSYFNENYELLPGPDFEPGLFYNLVEASQQVGERPTAAFPSSHVGISTILMIMAWKASRKLFLLLLPIYGLLCIATVYIQAHYIIDSIAGFLSGFILYYITEGIFNRWFSRPFLGKEIKN